MGRGPLNDDRLEAIDRVVMSGAMPDNDLEAIRRLICITTDEPPTRILVVDRQLIAAYLLQIGQALALAEYSATAIYVGILLQRFRYRARLRRPL